MADNLTKRNLLVGTQALIDEYYFSGDDVVLNTTDGKLYRATKDGFGNGSGVLTEVSAGGSAAGTWEAAYTRHRTASDPLDGSPVDTGVDYDPAYEWLAIVVERSTALTAITSAKLVGNHILFDPALGGGTFDTEARVSPDGGTTVYVRDGVCWIPAGFAGPSVGAGSTLDFALAGDSNFQLSDDYSFRTIRATSPAKHTQFYLFKRAT